MTALKPEQYPVADNASFVPLKAYWVHQARGGATRTDISTILQQLDLPFEYHHMKTAKEAASSKPWTIFKLTRNSIIRPVHMVTSGSDEICKITGAIFTHNVRKAIF